MKQLSKIVQGILEDAAILADPEEGRKAPPKAAANGGELKTKRLKLYDTVDESLSGAKRRLDALEVAIICHELTSLQTILGSGSWLLSPAITNLVLRFLLALPLSPAFFSFSPSSTLLASALTLCPALRSTVLSCLAAAVRSPIAREAPGALDLASQVFRQGIACNASARGEKEACRRGLDTLEAGLRPSVPPLLRTRGMRLGMRELAGGPIDKRRPKEVADEPQEAMRASLTTSAASIVPQTSHPTMVRQPLASTPSEPTIASTSSALGPIVPQMSVMAPTAPLTEAPVAGIVTAVEAPDASLPTEQASAGQPDVEVEAVFEADISMQEAEVVAEALVQKAEAQRRLVSPPAVFVRSAATAAAEESDSDDDAPMPRIVMSDDE